MSDRIVFTFDNKSDIYLGGVNINKKVELKKRSQFVVLPKIFFISLSAFIFLYLLRGFRFLAFLPGGIIMLPIAIALISGLIWGIKKTRRF